MEIEVNENFMFYITIFLIIITHLYPLIIHKMPVNWDAGFYFYMIKKNIDPIENKVEPFYFNLVRPFSKIFGVLEAMKLFQFLSIVILSLSTFLFINHNFDKKTAIIVMFLIAMIPATTRVWADQYRNMIALSLFSLLLFSLSRREKILSGILLGIIGLTHRFVFIFSFVSLMIYLFVKLLSRDSEKYRKVKDLIIILVISLIISSPFFLFVLFRNIEGEKSVLVRWDETLFNMRYVVNMTFFTIFFPICSLILVLFKIHDKKIINDVEIMLLILFLFSFLLASGLFGTPFLIYERYLLLFSIVSILFSSIYIQELFTFFDTKFKNTSLNIIIIILFVIVFTILSFKFIKSLTPFVYQNELLAFEWVGDNIPKNSTILVPSREYYWLKGISEANIVSLEWYELLGQRNLTDETKIIKGSIEESQKAIEKVKEKYNTSELYVFFTLGADPIITSYEEQELFLKKSKNWTQVKKWDNSYLFRI